MLKKIDLISGQLQDSINDPQAWEVALNSINAFVDGSGAVLLSVEERLRHAPVSSDLAEMICDYFDHGWYANDAREACVPALRYAGIVRDYDVLDMDRIDRFHSEFLARHNRKWFAGVGANLDGDLWCLALQRSSEKGPFLEADMPRLTVIRERLEETVVFARIGSRQWLDGAIAAFETESTAAIILDRAGRILHMSNAARSIVHKGQEKRLRGTGTPAVASSKAFEALLQSTLFAAPASSWLSMRVPVTFEGKTYTLEATWLLGRAALVFSKASLLVRVHPRTPDPREILKSRYRLTQSEIRVAMALASGLDVEAMSALFKVSPNTIRVQLKMAFAKTETGTQAKLVSFIAQLNQT